MGDKMERGTAAAIAVVTYAVGVGMGAGVMYLGSPSPDCKAAVEVGDALHMHNVESMDVMARMIGASSIAELDRGIRDLERLEDELSDFTEYADYRDACLGD